MGLKSQDFRVFAGCVVVAFACSACDTVDVSRYELAGEGGGVTPSPISLGGAASPDNLIFEGMWSTGYVGYSVADIGDFNGDGVNDYIVGAYGENAAYIVLGGGWLESATGALDLNAQGNSNIVGIFGESSGDQLGRSVAAAGDVNGDGLADVIVGARYADPATGGTDAGSAYIIFGHANPGWHRYASGIRSGAYPGVAIDGGSAYDYAGASVAAAGDFNDDGFDDVIIGAYGADDGGSSVGKAYVVFGHASWAGTTVDLDSLLTNQEGAELIGEQAGGQFGGAVGLAGDFNGDGIDDVVVGASRAPGFSTSSAGRAYVVYGRGAGFSINMGATDPGTMEVIGTESYGYLGRSVAGGGDFNRDGYDDVVLGAPYQDPGSATNAGAVFVVLGGDFGSDSRPTNKLVASDRAVEFHGADAFDYFGNSVGLGGDFNLDGLADVLVGATGADPGGLSNAGTAYVAYGADDPAISDQPVLAADLESEVGGMPFEGEAATDFAGRAVSFVSGPGTLSRPFVAIGASHTDRDGSTSNSGRVYMVRPEPLPGSYYALNRSPDTATDIYYAEQAELFSQSEPGVLANDIDHDGDPLQVMAAQFVTAEGCAAELFSDGSFTMAPPSNAWSGVCQAEYTADDGAGGSRVESLFVVYPEIAASELVAAGAGIIWNGEAQGDGAGASLDVLPDTNGDGRGELVVGAFGHDAGGLWSGRAYLVHGLDIPSERELSSVVAGMGGAAIDGEASFDWLGLSVASGGNFNGGTTELLVSSIGYDAGGERTGRIYQVDPAGLASFSPAFADQTGVDFAGMVYEGVDPLDDAGRGLASGDIDGDGLDDLLLGAYRADSSTDPDAEDVGVVYVVYGAAGALGDDVVPLSDVSGGALDGVRIEGEAPGDFAGYSISALGDLNGDGSAEVLIGAYGADAGGEVDAGKAYLVWGSNAFGSTESLSALAAGGGAVVFDGGEAHEFAGRAVANAGDVNGDGLDDILIGAPGADGGTGCAYLVFGEPGLTGSVSLSAIIENGQGMVFHGTDFGDGLGSAVAGLGDFNGDGLDDFALTSPFAATPLMPGAGRAFVILGGADLAPGFVWAADLTTAGFGVAINGEQPGDAFGFAVAGGEDLNADGYADLVVGAHQASPSGRQEAGRVYAVFGQPFAVDVVVGQ